MIYIGPFIKVKTEAIEKKGIIRQCSCVSKRTNNKNHNFCPICGDKYEFSEKIYYEHPNYLWISDEKFSCVTNERNWYMKDNELILIPNFGFKDNFQMEEKPFVNLEIINIENELKLFKGSIYFDKVIKEIKEKYNIKEYEVIFGILNT